jgi:hypothetical protein
MSSTTVERSSSLQAVREALRELLTGSEDYQRLDPSTRRDIAQGLVKICSTAVDLQRKTDTALSVPDAKKRMPLALAQNAGSEFSGVAAAKVADTTHQILNAVSFPRFVTELINGVFKALVDSNQQQLNSFVELIRNVSASMEGFADANIGVGGARQWLVERFPEAFTIEGETDPFAEPGQKLTPEEQAELDAETKVRLKPGASMPTEAALRAALGLGANESIPGGDPENLVGLVRASLARNRQQMLSTMVMLGLQRIVIESGRLNASMRFHIDTRSAATDDRGSQFDVRNTMSASGSFGYGPWGASASMSNTIGFVSTQKTQTTEEMNTDLDLNSSVELVFKTDYVPLDRLAGREQVDRIKVNTLNPESEIKAATEARKDREKRIADSESKRSESLDKAIAARPEPPTPKPGEPGSKEAADKAQKEGEEREKKDKAEKEKKEKAEKKAEPKPEQKTEDKEKAKAKETPAKTPADTTKKSGADAAKSKSKAQSLALEVEAENGNSKLQRVPDVIYVPTMDEAIDEMLGLANVTSKDLLYDLGCGDGRIVVTAAQKYGCRAVGFDIDPARVAESKNNVRNGGVSNLARIEERDIFQVDLRPADVVTLYLLPSLNLKLMPQISRMKPGSRVVSQDFDMAGAIPDRVVQVYLTRKKIYKTFYLWTTPLKLTVGPVPHEWSNAKGITD